MLLAPVHWFAHIPGAADTGPLNQHLVRDFGASYLLVGLIILVALARDNFSRVFHCWVTLFFLFHAAIHLWDLLDGRARHQQWAIDFPGVYLPAFILLVLSLPFAWERRTVG